ncbi:MAG TPA: BatA domain-containing protein [Trueperaceae bacterium]|nr:BatA domain-containing protein [Trueperaceae bacterium]
MSLTFHSPAFLWLLAAVPVVVLLHFLRARRRQHAVSALFLWERATHAASLRRRVRPSWLLLAQLLFTALAALALARPALAAREAPDRVIVIDASASMAAAAAPGEGAGTRLDLARDLARELARGAGRLALVRAGAAATLLAPLEASASERDAALSALAAGDAAADVSGALDLGAGLLPGAEVHVITDQALALGSARVHVVGEEVPNVGISAFTVGVGQVFVGVVASGPRPAEARVVLEQDGAELASSDVLVPAGGVGTVTFPIPDLAGVVTARVVGAPDALPLDDVAYAGSRPVTVVTDDTHGAATRALQAVPQTEVTYSLGAAGLSADLHVLTAGGTPTRPGPYVAFAAPAEEPTYAVIRDFDRAHPLLRFADLSEAVVGLDPAREPWPEDAAGWRVIARTADLTPVVRVREEGPLALDLAFHPSQTDLTLRPAFPALFANVLAAIATTESVRLGEAAAGGGPWLEPGVYGVDGGLVLVSLLSAGESRLPREGAPAGASAGPAGPAGSVPAPGDAPAAAVEPRGAGPSAPPGSAPTPLAVALSALALLALTGEWLLRRTRFAGA